MTKLKNDIEVMFEWYSVQVDILTIAGDPSNAFRAYSGPGTSSYGEYFIRFVFRCVCRYKTKQNK